MNERERFLLRRYLGSPDEDFTPTSTRGRSEGRPKGPDLGRPSAGLLRSLMKADKGKSKHGRGSNCSRDISAELDFVFLRATIHLNSG